MKGGRSKSDTKSAKLSLWKTLRSYKQNRVDFDCREDFRETYKKEHPKNKSVAAVGKAGGDKWKSLSAAEKAPFVAKADKRKVEYEKKMKAYNKEQAEGPKEEEESEKSVSEVNDEDEDDEEEGSAEEDDDDE
ncbi:HIGH MOBILITY GROUP B PROTEIN 2-LIKE [Salix purpurea]|uniref:HIGH MOBILITY GROUP B PROTEIN 2-LIKE n=1 Tax=Salix purpurea TaxID=77065 RepID=A0A9Q0SPS3_SALPP|nr:HIGH MOBILITY GROUP B PROTEIN 2-LIKE [Salix purpurea]